MSSLKCIKRVLPLPLLAIGAISCGVQTEERPLDSRDTDHESHEGTGGAGTNTPGVSGGTGGAPPDVSAAQRAGETIVYAPNADAWTHLSFSGGLQAVASHESWDLRVSRTVLGTNSGVSGPANAGALETQLSSLDALESCPSEGYIADQMLPLPGPPGSGEVAGNPVLNAWYNYDSSTHAVTTKGIVYCLKTSTGAVAGLRVRNYAAGQMTLQWKHL